MCLSESPLELDPIWHEGTTADSVMVMRRGKQRRRRLLCLLQSAEEEAVQQWKAMQASEKENECYMSVDFEDDGRPKTPPPPQVFAPQVPPSPTLSPPHRRQHLDSFAEGAIERESRSAVAMALSNHDVVFCIVEFLPCRSALAGLGATCRALRVAVDLSITRISTLACVGGSSSASPLPIGRFPLLQELCVTSDCTPESLTHTVQGLTSRLRALEVRGCVRPSPSSPSPWDSMLSTTEAWPHLRRLGVGNLHELLEDPASSHVLSSMAVAVDTLVLPFHSCADWLAPLAEHLLQGGLPSIRKIADSGRAGMLEVCDVGDLDALLAILERAQDMEEIGISLAHVPRAQLRSGWALDAFAGMLADPHTLPKLRSLSLCLPDANHACPMLHALASSRCSGKPSLSRVRLSWPGHSQLSGRLDLPPGSMSAIRRLEMPANVAPRAVMSIMAACGLSSLVLKGLEGQEADEAKDASSLTAIGDTSDQMSDDQQDVDAQYGDLEGCEEDEHEYDDEVEDEEADCMGMGRMEGVVRPKTTWKHSRWQPLLWSAWGDVMDADLHMDARAGLAVDGNGAAGSVDALAMDQ